jgi:hypothetical protein
MVRYTLFVLTVLGSAATALASIQPAAIDLSGKNVTVIEKNQFWSDLNPAEFAQCAKEDCSDTPQG